MRLPVWKRKSMLAQAIAQETPEPQPASGRREAILRLMEQYEPALRRLTAGYADQPADREDLFQEIAMALWQALPNYRGEASERTWLYRIAHNIAITASTRRWTRRKREEPMPEMFDAPSPAMNSEDELLRSERQGQLLSAIRSLPTVDRQLVLLHFEGLSHAEIQQISGLSQSAIATRLSRLRDRLKHKVQAASGAEGSQL